MDTDFTELNTLISRLKLVADKKAVSLIMANSVIGDMSVRIHKDGKDANNTDIGVYSGGYMKLRTGNYVNSKRVTRGKNEGKTKDAGTISRGKNKGQPRVKYNRTSDNKVVLSLTRQMENDLSVLPTVSGYGIGYKNEFNFDKSQWAEQRYKREIFSLTKEEEQQVVNGVNEYINALSR